MHKSARLTHLKGNFMSNSTTADVTGIFSLDTNRLVGLAAKGAPDVTYLAGQDTPTSGIPLTATLSDGGVGSSWDIQGMSAAGHVVYSALPRLNGHLPTDGRTYSISAYPTFARLS